ncbi:ABC transporter G family member 2 [Nymphaea thermarum]|nr:ABC transporter G family member 2 [Nymphaea thermarum]
MRFISAYVRQDDLLFPMLTVEEMLSFAAEFRLPQTLSKEKKQARVQALIEQLGLRRAAKTIIGDEGPLPSSAPPLLPLSLSNRSPSLEEPNRSPSPFPSPPPSSSSPFPSPSQSPLSLLSLPVSLLLS